MVLRITGVIVLITLIINIIISVLVFSRGRKKKANRLFSLFVLSIAFWNLCNFLADSIQDPVKSILWMKMSLVGPILIPFFFILFSINFPLDRKISKTFLNIILIPAIILLVLTPTALNVKDLSVESWGANFTPGFLYLPFTLYFVFYMGIGLYFFHKSYQEVAGKKKIQILYVFWGALTAAGLGIITNAVLPLLGISRLDPLGSPLSLVFTIAVSYAILRYRLLDIRVILKKSLIYIVLFAMILAIYAFGILLVHSKLTEIVSVESNVTLYLMLIIVSISYTPLKRLVQKYMDRVFSYDSVDFSRHLDYFQEKTKGIIQLESLTEKVIQEVKKVIPVGEVSFLVKDQKENIFHEFVSDSKRKEKRLSFNNALVSLLTKTREIIIKEELEQAPYPGWVKDFGFDPREIRRLSKHLGASLCLPILDDEQLIGIVVAGEKASKEAFTSEELSYLKSLAPRISYALSNVLIYHYALLRVLRMAESREVLEEEKF